MEANARGVDLNRNWNVALKHPEEKEAQDTVDQRQKARARQEH